MTDVEYWMKLYEIAMGAMQHTPNYAQASRHEAIIDCAEGLDCHLQGKLYANPPAPPPIPPGVDLEGVE